MAERRTYTQEFKADAVAKLKEEGATLTSVAKEVGVHPNLLAGWRDKANAVPGTPTFPTTRTPKAGSPTSMVALMETIMAAHGIKMPPMADIEKGAKAISGLDKGIEMDDARLIAATVLNAVSA